MLQLILGQNAAAAAAAAAAERKRAAARSRELQSRSGSTAGISAGGASVAVATDSFVSSIDGSMVAGPGPLAGGLEGMGHTAAAVRALTGSSSAGALVRGGSGVDDELLHDSPHSAAMSDLSHLSQATDSSVAVTAGGGGPVPAAGGQQLQANSSGGGLVEQLLLEYEIEFVQVQVSK